MADIAGSLEKGDDPVKKRPGMREIGKRFSPNTAPPANPSIESLASIKFTTDLPRCTMPDSRIAIIDVETTGLFPNRHDRVVELAAVVIESDGSVVREFVTLVNPRRDIGPSSIHGLTSEDILHAPEFAEIAGMVVETLQGTVAIASHNVRFDQQFMEYEFSRIDLPVPDCFTICTLRLAGGGSLSDCCADFGISPNGDRHHALADARATAQLLSVLLSDEPRMIQKLSRLMPIQWPAIRTTGRQPITRDESRRRQSVPPTFLQRLLGRMPNVEPVEADDASMEYMALLERVLEDRHVDDSEADALVEMATRWGLSGSQINLAHHRFLHQLAMVAVADGVVTEAERRDLKLVARLLGLEKQDLDAMLREASTELANLPAPITVSTAEMSLSGKRVCFTGELQCRRNGDMIPRECAEELATNAGLIVMESVTKKLDLLVLADPHSQSGKAKKARQYGIRIMHEPVFWKAIGVHVE